MFNCCASALIILSLLCQFPSGLGKGRPSIAEIYLKIDDYLIRHEKSDDTKANMDKARELLNSLHKTNCPFIIGCLNATNSHYSSQLKVQALKELLALERIRTGKAKCNRQDYEILLTSDLNTNGRAHLAFKNIGDEPIKRVDKIVYRYHLQHAKDCRAIYPINFKRKWAQIDQSRIQGALALVNRLMNLALVKASKTAGNKRRYLDSLMSFQLSGSKAAHLQLAYDALLSMAKNDPDLRIFLNEMVANKRSFEDKFMKLYEKYLFAPCKYYVQELGPDIFVPADYEDSMFLHSFKPYKEELLDFYLGLVRYRLCKSLITQKYLLNGLVKKSFANQLIMYIIILQANKQQSPDISNNRDKYIPVFKGLK